MDLMVEHMRTQVKTMVNRTTVGPMQGRQGMGQMRDGMGRSGMGRCNVAWVDPAWARGSGAVRAPTNSPLLQ